VGVHPLKVLDMSALAVELLVRLVRSTPRLLSSGAEKDNAGIGQGTLDVGPRLLETREQKRVDEDGRRARVVDLVSDFSRLAKG